MNKEFLNQFINNNRFMLSYNIILVNKLHLCSAQSKKRIKRLHDFITTNIDETHDENASYYNTAHLLWNNRSKLFTSLKKPGFTLNILMFRHLKLEIKL